MYYDSVILGNYLMLNNRNEQQNISRNQHNVGVSWIIIVHTFHALLTNQATKAMDKSVSWHVGIIEVITNYKHNFFLFVNNI